MRDEACVHSLLLFYSQIQSTLHTYLTNDKTATTVACTSDPIELRHFCRLDASKFAGFRIDSSQSKKLLRWVNKTKESTMTTQAVIENIFKSVAGV